MRLHFLTCGNDNSLQICYLYTYLKHKYGRRHIRTHRVTCICLQIASKYTTRLRFVLYSMFKRPCSSRVRSRAAPIFISPKDEMRGTWNEKILFPRMSDSNVLRFLLLCGKLKRTVRAGWTRYNINSPESVSDHMYRMALMATVIPTNERGNLNTDRLLKMAIVHDLAECIVGDITPHCGVSKEEKLSREKDAMKQLCELISEENSAEIMSLWKEYVDQQTPEAVICKDFDKFEMLLQAYEYEHETLEPGKLESFFESTLGTFSTSLGQKWVKELCLLRKNLFIQCESSDKRG
ncbi:unnamed protein product [Schistosoma intercalatum]|nr:unnamed protein product [Schistosoma intercalatum]